MYNYLRYPDDERPPCKSITAGILHDTISNNIITSKGQINTCKGYRSYNFALYNYLIQSYYNIYNQSHLPKTFATTQFFIVKLVIPVETSISIPAPLPSHTSISDITKSLQPSSTKIPANIPPPTINPFFI